MIAQKGLPDQVPYVVKKCIEQIDADGLQVKVALSLRSELSFTDDRFSSVFSKTGFVNAARSTLAFIWSLGELFVGFFI